MYVHMYKLVKLQHVKANDAPAKTNVHLHLFLNV